jgi:putative phage-type endonuclease
MNQTQTTQTLHSKEYYNKERGVYIERIPEKDEEWHKRRSNGIGASDIGRILGLNDYEGGSCIEIFYEKIGLKPAFRGSNKYTFWGHQQEELIANAWKYYDGTKDSYIFNYEKNNKVRDCRNVHGVLSNEKYPHLFTNIDRLITKGCFKLTDGTMLEDNGILECKTGSSWVAKKWQEGIDPMYVMQVQQQLMIMGLEYAEIAFLELDNRELWVYPVEANKSLISQIEEQSYVFWYKMVLPAKKLVAERELELNRGNMDAVRKIEYEIQKLEPSADGSERYKDFMNQRWLSEPDIIKADESQLINALELKYYKELIKELERDVTLKENIIRQFMGDNINISTNKTPDTLDFDEYGKITWKTEGKNLDRKVLRTISFKGDVSDSILKSKEQINNNKPKI